VTVALHFIARSRPLAEPLPTARFIPSRPMRARTRSIALSDLLLLFVRLLAIAAVGLAVAGPVVGAARGRVARVIIADRSRAVAGIAEVRDSVRALARAGDVLIAFDSAATAIGSPDSLTRSEARGSLSAGIAGAIRGAVSLARSADSAELVIVSPLAVEEVDAATERLRAAWPGRARVVRVRGAAPADTSPVVESMADENDVVLGGLSLVAPVRHGGWLRLVRGRVSAADSAWAHDNGHVLVHWPSADSGAHWPKRATIDAIGAVASATGVVVARFPRLWALDGPAIARWADGEVAATERPLGNGCVRDVGILFDPSSDVTLRAPFRAFVRAMLAPCGGERAIVPVDASAMATLSGSGPLAAADALHDRDGESSAWTPWLLGAAALLLILELALRRMRAAVTT
jgi:hypothetical protein